MKKNIFETMQGWAVLVAAQFLALSGTGKGIVILIIMFHLDLITGTYASWYEAKLKAEKPKVYFIESKKLRQSVAKAMWYVFLVLGVWMLEYLYFDKAFGVPYSSKEFVAHQIAIGVCIAIEFWSNLENFKRCGFDVILKIKTISLKVWGLVKTVKNGDEN